MLNNKGPKPDPCGTPIKKSQSLYAELILSPS